MPWATAAGLDQATAFYFRFIAFIPRGVDGWMNKPHEGRWENAPQFEIQFSVTNSWQLSCFGLFFFFFLL